MTINPEKCIFGFQTEIIGILLHWAGSWGQSWQVKFYNKYVHAKIKERNAEAEPNINDPIKVQCKVNLTHLVIFQTSTERAIIWVDTLMRGRIHKDVTSIT